MKRRNPLLWIGSSMLAAIVLAAALAGLVSPHGPTEQLYRDLTLAPPSWAHWVGVDGVGREVVIIRPIRSERAMTATPAPLPPALLDELRVSLLALPGVGAAFLDVTSKPPGTIEWE